MRLIPSSRRAGVGIDQCLATTVDPRVGTRLLGENGFAEYLEMLLQPLGGPTGFFESSCSGQAGSQAPQEQILLPFGEAEAWRARAPMLRC